MVNAKPFQAPFFYNWCTHYYITLHYHSSGNIEDRSMVALR